VVEVLHAEQAWQQKQQVQLHAAAASIMWQLPQVTMCAKNCSSIELNV
jgi:hypothetical protein